MLHVRLTIFGVADFCTKAFMVKLSVEEHNDSFLKFHFYHLNFMLFFVLSFLSPLFLYIRKKLVKNVFSHSLSFLLSHPPFYSIFYFLVFSP